MGMPASFGHTNAVIKGRAFPPLQSRFVQAKLRVDAETAKLVDEAGAVLTSCPRVDVIIEQRIGRAPRRVTLPDGTLFESEDHDEIEDVFGVTAGSFIHRMERLHPRMIGFVVVAVFSVWMIWRYGLDIMAGVALALTPPQVIDAVDAGTLQTVDLIFAEPTASTSSEQKAAQAIFETLLATLDPDVRADHDFNLEFRAMPGMGPNALALPGGTVIMTDELMRLFPSPDVQAGVLAHEIGHVVEQHGMRQLYRSIGIAVFVALLAGDTVPIVEEMLLEGNVLLSLSFSRKAENEADSFGVELAAQAGYDPAGLIPFFEWIEHEIGDTASSWLSTHPSSTERMQRLEELITSQ